MQELGKWVLSLSLSGSLVILGLFLLCRIWGQKISGRFQYYIWLVALVRLLVPVSVEINLVGDLFAKAQQQIGQEQAQGFGTMIEPLEEEDSTEGVFLSEEETDTAVDNRQGTLESSYVVTKVQPVKKTGFVHVFTENLTLIWLMVALFFLAQRMVVYQRFVRSLRLGSIPADMELLERFGRMIEEKQVRGTIELKINPLVSSPMLVGFFRPQVVLPTAELSEQDFYYTVLHELIHCRRKDLLYKWLVQFTICLHWFNPFAYLMGREINRACELACDEAVIQELDTDGKRAYGDTLLRAAAVGGPCFTSLGTLTMHESKRLLKGRLQSIVEYHKKPGWVRALSLELAVAIAVGALTLGAYAKPKTDEGFTGSGYDFLLSDGTKVIERNHVFYILCDGVVNVEVPVSDTVDGIMIVVVNKEAYVSVLLPDDLEGLEEEAEKVCAKMQERGILTEEDVAYMTEVAAELQKREQPVQSLEYEDDYYIQSIYYRDGYLFYVGYNLTEESVQNHAGTEISLQDGEALHVSFAESDRQWMEQTEFLQVLSELFSEFRQMYGKRVSLIQRPVVSSVEYVGTDVESLIATYYEEEEIGIFSALIPELDTNGQKDYLEKAFLEDNTACFSIILNHLADENQLDEALVNDYMQRAYDTGEIAYFAICSDYLSEGSIQRWKEQLPSQGKDSPYTSVLQDLIEETEDDKMWEDWE